MQALIITPAYTHVHHALTQAVADSGIPWQVLYEHSDLVRVRSVLIEQALAAEAEVIVFCDADTVPLPGVLLSLVESAYPGRAVFGMYPLRDGRKSVQPVNPETAGAEPYPIVYAGLGLAAVHRDDLLKVAESLPTVTNDAAPWRPFCLPFVDADGVYHGDDRSLCARLRASGCDLWAAPSLEARHVVSVALGL